MVDDAKRKRTEVEVTWDRKIVVSWATPFAWEKQHMKVVELEHFDFSRDYSF